MAISTNMGDFMRGLDKDIEKRIKQRDDLAKSIIVKTYDAIITSSPVDTSYYKANHFISEDSPSKELVAENGNDFKGSVTATEVKSKRVLGGIKLSNGKRVFIANNTKYAQALEDGHSKQNRNMYHNAEELAKDLINRGF